MYQRKFVATRTGERGGIEQYLKNLPYLGMEEDDNLLRYYFVDEDKYITVDFYKVGHKLIILNVESETNDLKNFIPKKGRNHNKKGLVDVTNHEYYQDTESIMKHILPYRVVIEGPKGVGKSTAVRYLIQKGISAKDRDQDVFSNDFILDLPHSIQTKICGERIHQNEDEYFFILSCSETELEKRLARRKKELRIPNRHSDLEYRNFYQAIYRSLQENNLLDDQLFYVKPIADAIYNRERFQPILNITRDISKQYKREEKVKKRV